MGKVYYSLDDGPWTEYQAPFTIKEGTCIRAFAMPLDPESYSESETSMQNYGVIR